MTSTAVVLIAHGTVETLEQLPAFLTNIRRGHPPPPELLAEVRRRYEAIGGASPLMSITRELAAKLEARLALPVRVAMRLFDPYPREVLAALGATGARRIVVVPLAQHSAPIYTEAVRAAARELDGEFELVAAPNWGLSPGLTAAFAGSIVRAFDGIAPDAAARTRLVVTAHSLPRAVIDAGDPYEREFRASAEAVVAAVRSGRPTAFADHRVGFQSQGMSAGPGGRPAPWLGPDLRSLLEEARGDGVRRIVVAPIGFLADHVEILYDLDIEAREWAEKLGMSLMRSASLNASDPLVDVLAKLVGGLLRG